MSATDIELIGAPALASLLDTIGAVKEVRSIVAHNTPPYVADDACERRAICERDWQLGWKLDIARLVHHPDRPIALAEIVPRLEAARIGDMCVACKTLTVEGVAENGLLGQEAKYIEDGVAVVQAMFPSQMAD
ncbi:hypothetical protein MKEN_01387900 [Mycena kentingensis (nom. inval.)]|nr:hypothetical protein MKEN_01387900 [Mycena kentingensis (nom. inval.)]